MSVTTTVVARIEINVDGKWGDDCTVDQVKRQAMENANLIISKALEADPNRIKLIAKLECVSINYKEGI